MKKPKRLPRSPLRPFHKVPLRRDTFDFARRFWLAVERLDLGL